MLNETGGADRDQTGDLVVANDALYQLSYCPEQEPVVLKGRALRVNLIFRHLRPLLATSIAQG